MACECSGRLRRLADRPRDLVPDFIPVIGYLDDLLIVPGLAWLALKQIDPALLAELRERAGKMPSQE
jgi:uncharacterized membrane protein YkvA (DUF1232 family)